MHPLKKKIILGITFLMAITPIFLLYMTFSNSRGCEQFDIDSYEIHSGINIPKVSSVNCYYDEGMDTRISIYDLKGSIDLGRFEPLSDDQKDYLRGISLLADAELPQGTELYVASGERWKTGWTYVVDRKSNRLWAELSY